MIGDPPVSGSPYLVPRPGLHHGHAERQSQPSPASAKRTRAVAYHAPNARLTDGGLCHVAVWLAGRRSTLPTVTTGGEPQCGDDWPWRDGVGAAHPALPIIVRSPDSDRALPLVVRGGDQRDGLPDERGIACSATSGRHPERRGEPCPGPAAIAVRNTAPSGVTPAQPWPVGMNVICVTHPAVPGDDGLPRGTSIVGPIEPVGGRDQERAWGDTNRPVSGSGAARTVQPPPGRR